MIIMIVKTLEEIRQERLKSLEKARDCAQMGRDELNFHHIKKINIQDPEYWTYLMYDGEKYKIGKSKNPEERLSQLKTGNPSCILVLKTKKLSEKLMHSLFREKRLSREWFYLTDKDVKTIADICEAQYEVFHHPLVMHYFRRYRVENRAKNYIISFGKYKGTKITDMTNNDQIDYINWFLSKGSFSKTEKKRNPYTAFVWWRNMDYKLQSFDGSVEDAVRLFKEKEDAKKERDLFFGIDHFAKTKTELLIEKYFSEKEKRAQNT